jgi:hypothetical protein
MVSPLDAALSRAGGSFAADPYRIGIDFDQPVGFIGHLVISS